MPFKGLFKVRPLLDHLFEKFQTTYEPHREVSVDESLMLWKGRLLFKQFLPLKRHRFGLKLYKLCESTTGYTYRFQDYYGKDSQFTLPAGVLTPTGPLSATEKTVWLPLLNKGYHLYCDNFYSSPTPFDLLWQFATPACGTARANRKDTPKQLLSKKQQVGQSSFTRRGSLLASKFMDKEDIHMLSTIHAATCTTVSVRCRSTLTMKKPDCVLSYNIFMGGVDMCDQLMQPNDATHKTVVWYKNLGIYLFQHALVNAFVLYRQSVVQNPRRTLLEFEHDVIADLMMWSKEILHLRQ